jgi:hypothetical protein
MDLVLCLTSPIGGIIEDKIGGKKTILLSTSIVCGSFLLMYFSKIIFFDYLIMCLIGIGLAVGINITRKNVCSFFLNRKALISGILFLVPGFLCAGLNIFNEKYILNPDSESPSIDNLYYKISISSNFQKLIISEIVLLAVTSILTLLLYFPNNPKETIKYGFGENAMTDNVENIETTKNNTSKQMKLKKAIYNIRAIKLFIMFFLFFPTINFINITWRAIGIYYKINTYYLQMIGALYFPLYCL